MKLNINNIIYNVYVVEPNDRHLLMPDECYHFGVTHFKEKAIYLMNDLPKYSLEYTIRHELTHAYIDSYGFMQVAWNDEIIADFFAYYAKNILQDAEKVLKYYKKEVK